MAQVPIQEFNIGDIVSLADGRSGVVLQAVFNPNGNEYQYDIEGVGAFFLESDLHLFDPTVLPPLEIVEPPDIVVAPGLPRGALEALEARLDENIAQVVRGAITVTVELEGRVNERLKVLRDDIAALGKNLGSLDVTLQSELEERSQANVELDRAAAEGGLLGFVGRVTGFITSPTQAFLDLIGGWFLGEVEDGLNR